MRDDKKNPIHSLTFSSILVGVLLILTACRATPTSQSSPSLTAPVISPAALFSKTPTNQLIPTATQTLPSTLEIASTGTIQTAANPQPSPSLSPTATEEPHLTFAVIGDYGLAGTAEAEVAQMVLGWELDLIITTGDNNYPNGSSDTIDENIGQYYHSFIFPYLGSYGEGADTNRFFPSIGNHDWRTNEGQPFLDFFTLPGNERYYTFSWGPVDFFAINSDSHEPDGVGRSSNQGSWLKESLAKSSAQWKIVYTHYPPYSSAYHGSTDWIQWPFAAWGADAVLAGHDHTYERLVIEGIPYFVNGLGGASPYSFVFPLPGSLFRYNDLHGAMWVEATKEKITFRFYAVPGTLIDSYQLVKSGSN